MNGDLDLIHRWEPGRGGRTLLLLHGTGGDEHDLVDLGRSLAPDANLLSPRGKVLEGGAPRFFRRLAPGVFDEADLIARTHELADFVGRAAARYGFDPARVTGVGFSNGANIAASLLLLRPEVLAGAVLLRAMIPLTPARLPDLAGRGVLLAAGLADHMVPPEGTQRLAQLLENAGASVTLHWSPSGHFLDGGDIGAARDWLDRRAKAA